MDDKAHVMEAYGTTIRLMFRVFFESFTAAKGNTEDERNAEERFRAGSPTHATSATARLLCTARRLGGF